MTIPARPTRTTRRALTALVASVACLGLATSAAQAATPEAQTSAGALARYLSANDDHLHTTFDGQQFDSDGPTLDAVLSLDAAGVASGESTAALSYVSDHLGDYIGDGTSEAYAGATAKALLAAEANHPEQTGYLGGVDLVSRLQGLENTKGRFRDTSQYGDFSNTIGESLALISLDRAGEDLSKASRTFLRLQQCPGGGFRLNMSATQCTDGKAADPDATAYAVQALLALSDSAKRTQLLDAASLYLKGLQMSGGGVPDGAGGVPNANTTGLVAASMRAVGRDGIADRAVSFLTTLRFGCNFPEALRGTIAYSVADKAATKAQGTAATVSEQTAQATSQAVQGLAGKAYSAITVDGASTTTPTFACAEK